MVTKYFAPLVLMLGACASTTTADVRRMSRDGDVDALLATWDKSTRDTMRVTIVEELAVHGDDRRARDIVVRNAASASSEPVRLAAIRGLTKLEGDDVNGTLIRGLGDPSPSVRDLSRATLEGKGQDVIAPLEVAAASEPNHLVRASALRLLTRGVDRKLVARPAIEKILVDRAQRDDAPKVREAAAKGLGSLRCVAARPVLSELEKTDENPSVRMAAGKALGMLGQTEEKKEVVVAVLPLKNDTGANDPELARFGAQIRDYVQARLGAAKVCSVIDRDKIDQAVAEMRKIGKQLYDGDSPNAPDIGYFKLANQLVYGTVQKQGSQFTIVLQRMDVSTLALVPGSSATVTGYRADLEQLKVEVTERFLARFR